MKVNIILIILILLSSFHLFSSEKEIEIIQKTKSKYLFKLNNKILNDTEIISTLNTNTEAQSLFIKAKKGFVGASVMLGLGIGFSPVFTAFCLTSIISAAYGMITTNISTLSLFCTFVTVGPIGLLGCLTIWIIGALLRSHFRKEEKTAVEMYNQFLKNGTSSNSYINTENKIQISLLQFGI